MDFSDSDGDASESVVDLSPNAEEEQEEEKATYRVPHDQQCRLRPAGQVFVQLAKWWKDREKASRTSMTPMEEPAPPQPTPSRELSKLLFAIFRARHLQPAQLDATTTLAIRHALKMAQELHQKTEQLAAAEAQVRDLLGQYLDSHALKGTAKRVRRSQRLLRLWLTRRPFPLLIQRHPSMARLRVLLSTPLDESDSEQMRKTRKRRHPRRPWSLLPQVFRMRPLQQPPPPPLSLLPLRRSQRRTMHRTVHLLERTSKRVPSWMTQDSRAWRRRQR